MPRVCAFLRSSIVTVIEAPLLRGYELRLAAGEGGYAQIGQR
jgi:hypothetical protein